MLFNKKQLPEHTPFWPNQQRQKRLLREPSGTRGSLESTQAPWSTQMTFLVFIYGYMYKNSYYKNPHLTRNWKLLFQEGTQRPLQGILIPPRNFFCPLILSAVTWASCFIWELSNLISKLVSLTQISKPLMSTSVAVFCLPCKPLWLHAIKASQDFCSDLIFLLHSS